MGCMQDSRHRCRNDHSTLPHPSLPKTLGLQARLLLSGEDDTIQTDMRQGPYVTGEEGEQ
jgi:hypothetical protein